MQHPNLAFEVAVQAATCGGAMPIAISEPGMGKSAYHLALAPAMGYDLIMMIGSTLDPIDVAGLPCIIRNDTGVESVKMIPRDFVAHCHKRKTVIFLDEFSNCPPAVFAALLALVQDRRIGDYILPPNTIFTAAMNPEDISANGMELPPPMANRCYHHKWQLDTDTILNGFMSGMEFESPSIKLLPTDWQNQIGYSGAMIASYLMKMPSATHQFPKDRAKQSGAFPTPRSWSYGIRLLAAAESIGAERLLKLELLTGVVGEPAALQYFEYADNLDIPDVNQMIDEIIAARKTKGGSWCYKHPERNDQVLAMLAQLNQTIVANPTPERWDASMEIVKKIMEQKNCFETVMGGVKPLMVAMPEGCNLPPALTTMAWEKMRRAMSDN